MSIVCKVWLNMILIHIADKGFWLVLSMDVGTKLAKPH